MHKQQQNGGNKGRAKVVGEHKVKVRKHAPEMYEPKPKVAQPQAKQGHNGRDAVFTPRHVWNNQIREQLSAHRQAKLEQDLAAMRAEGESRRRLELLAVFANRQVIEASKKHNRVGPWCEVGLQALVK